jgi:hypothetical protein
MRLLAENPNSIQFADPFLFKDWYRGVANIKDELKNNIKEKGILDPIIVYRVEIGSKIDEILRNAYPFLQLSFILSNYWCWRGTQRLRLARYFDFPYIKCLCLDEPYSNQPNFNKIKSLYRKRIKLFFHEGLERWDVVAQEENDGSIIYT